MCKLEAKASGLGHRMHLADLSSMAETRKVGAAIAASEPRVDVLINNAGVMFSDRRVTPEGLGPTFPLHHMASFVLTQALREKLIVSAPARIVSTASDAHQGAKLELARRLAGTGVTANCLHPGFVATRFGHSAGGWTGFLVPFAQAFALSPEKG